MESFDVVDANYYCWRSFATYAQAKAWAEANLWRYTIFFSRGFETKIVGSNY